MYDRIVIGPRIYNLATPVPDEDSQITVAVPDDAQNDFFSACNSPHTVSVGYLCAGGGWGPVFDGHISWYESMLSKKILKVAMIIKRGSKPQ